MGMFDFITDPIGSIFGSGLDAIVSGRQASKNREFQNEMSSTAHQREVHDLKLAGLNPILSAGGRGASSPSGNMASPSGLGVAAAGASGRAIQRKHMEANVAQVKQRTATDAFDAKIQTDAEKVYDSSAAVRKTIMGGVIGHKAGLTGKLGPIGAVVGAGFSAKDAILRGMKWKKGPTKEQVKTKRQQEILDYYNRGQAVPWQGAYDPSSPALPF